MSKWILFSVPSELWMCPKLAVQWWTVHIKSIIRIPWLEFRYHTCMVPYLWQNSVFPCASLNTHVNVIAISCIFKCRYKVIVGSNFQIWVGGFNLFGCQVAAKPVCLSPSLKEKRKKSENRGAWVEKRTEITQELLSCEKQIS